VLRKAGDILLTEVRTMDIPARYGGDEFAVILPEADAEGAAIVAQRILHRVAKEQIAVGAESLSFSMSVGIAVFPRHTSEDAATLIARADEALYHVKHTGKGRLSVYGEWEDEPIPRE